MVGKQDSETFLSKAPHSWLLRQKHQGVRVLGKKSQKYKQVQNLQVPGDCSASPREGKGGGILTTAILETKGAWRKEKYARPEAEVPRQQKKKTRLRDLN